MLSYLQESMVRSIRKSFTDIGGSVMGRPAPRDDGELGQTLRQEDFGQEYKSSKASLMATSNLSRSFFSNFADPSRAMIESTKV